ncbi:NADH-quinone oxidoreductase subunit NuoH [Polymorphobacter fuscus]|uniref:NADH-quinone oxidoreductase subunit H n=1 Tax=Sandarakinorhabdus fusca TaxID=1439888 RepID=A0A7C9KPQ0_9SPHN|nr:NADH-quinone oxidoreductase subunit NuoH [Polymorphobacter fuscus]KAB7643736.1 NADH-quinone oxidoreductase subunit NuoH [Polymorphobacter fuscus]MQT18684.1 NADH-quinone oxidoreductase subunit NuoH [Polymorphobacter fuscus]
MIAAWPVLLFSLVLVAALLVAAGVFTWVERRVLGFMQERLGPNRVGPFGFLQWVADTIKLLTKEDAPPQGADAAAFRLAPALAALPTLAGFGVVAFGNGLAVAPLDMGLVFIIGMLALTVYALVLGAWASRNRYALLGGLRAAAQMLAYEAFLGLSLMGVVVLAGSFALADIVAAQQGLWFIIVQPIGAVLFFIAALAAAHRLPFDLQESENDLVAGFMTEYSGMSFARFFLGEYVAVLLVCALAVTLFFGGWLGPVLPGPVWFGLKVSLLAFVFIWVRAALPRPRYDQLIAFAWKFALPLALANLLVTGWLVVA